MVLNNCCLRHTALIALLLPLLSPQALADYEAGLKAYKRNNFSRARTEFFHEAMLGHSGAQFYLGEIHEGGVGVAANYTSAFKWYRSAAQQEHAHAQRRLAYLYSHGLGTDRDESKAFAWYLRSADNGDVLAQLEVGLRYWQGQGTGKNALEAYKWLTVSASYGDPDALAERGQLDTDLSAADKQKALALARGWEQRWEKRSRPEAPCTGRARKPVDEAPIAQEGSSAQKNSYTSCHPTNFSIDEGTNRDAHSLLSLAHFTDRRTRGTGGGRTRANPVWCSVYCATGTYSRQMAALHELSF